MPLSNVTACAEAVAEASMFTVPSPGNYFLILILIMLSGLFSGLTLGLLSLDKMGLQIVIGGGDPVLAVYAKAIMPVRERGNQLLCTLLLGNVAVNSMLSILMADMTSGLVGFLASTVLIVIFGEIVPQASCSRHALFMGYYTLYITKFFMATLFIIAYPLGYLLDRALGEDLGTIHSRGELSTLLELHVKHGAVDVESGNMLHGALKFREMTVHEIMTPVDEVFMVSLADTLNYALMTKIFRAGYSRIPVYDNDVNDITGIILSKDLMLVDPKDETPVRNFMTLFGRVPIIIWPDNKLGVMLNVFRQGNGHIAVVRDVNNTGPGDPFYECKGIVTLEDIVEEIIGEEIMDELDDQEEAGGGQGANNVEDRDRDRDLAMLALLNGKTEEQKLSIEEVQAVSSHLMNNVPQFEDTCKEASGGVIMDRADVQVVLSQASVVVAERLSADSQLSHRCPEAGDILYAAARPSDMCILILAGKVVVYAGHDQFRSELGPWSLIGMDALRSADDYFTPDFTAYILSASIRYLVLTKQALKITPLSPVPKRRSKGGGGVGSLGTALVESLGSSTSRVDKGKRAHQRRKNHHSTAAAAAAADGIVIDSSPDGDDVVSPFWTQSTAPVSNGNPRIDVSSSGSGLEMSPASNRLNGASNHRSNGGRPLYEPVGVQAMDDDEDRSVSPTDLLGVLEMAEDDSIV
jgi:metal transporter CNNM